MEEKKEVQEKEKSRCTKCGSTLVYIRIKDKQKVCRSCGNVEEME